MLNLFVDADACPRPVKDVLFKMAQRRKVKTLFVANHHLRIPESAFLGFLLVEKGFDVADEAIAEQLKPGDVVITADIPLAADVIKAGAHVLNFRGEAYDEDNINNRLALRDLMADLRDLGQEGGGPPPFSPKDRQHFVNALDRLLTQILQAP